MTTTSPTLTVRTSAPTASTTPMASWPMRRPESLWSSVLYGHRSLPQMAARLTTTSASVGSITWASGTFSIRTSPAPYMTVARIVIYLVLPAARARRARAMSRGRGRRRFAPGDRHQRAAELGRIAGLLAAQGIPPLQLLGGAIGVVLEGRLSVGHRLLREELGAEEAGVDDGGADGEWRDLGLQRFHPALEPELRGGVGGTELRADEARARRDRDDVARALLAHDGQDGAGDVHRAEQARRQLPLDLLGRQLLEVAGIEVGGVVDQHVDAAEALDGGLHHCLGVGTAGDVELDDQQVVRLADGIRHGVGVAAGGDDGVAGGEGRLRDLDAHAAAGAGDEPNLLLSHVLQVPPSICFLLAARGRLTGRSPAPRTPGR